MLASPLRLASLLVLAGATLAPSAGAQQPGSAAAEALFQEGQTLMARGEIEAACRKYEASQKLDPTVGTLLHLADCYEAVGFNASAWATFRKASYDAAAQRDERREHIASTRARALEPRLSRVELKVAPARRPPGLVVRLGEFEVPEASWGTRLPSDPGPRRVVVSAPGYRSWTRTIQVPPAGVVEVAIPELEAASDESVRDPGAARYRPWVWASAGAGAASLAAGLTLGLIAYSRNERSLEECRAGDETRCTPRGVELRDEARDFAAASTVAFTVAGVLGATALTLEIARPRERGPSSVLTLRVRDRGGAVLELGGEF